MGAGRRVRGQGVGCSTLRKRRWMAAVAQHLGLVGAGEPEGWRQAGGGEGGWGHLMEFEEDGCVACASSTPSQYTQTPIWYPPACSIMWITRRP